MTSLSSACSRWDAQHRKPWGYSCVVSNPWGAPGESEPTWSSASSFVKQGRGYIAAPNCSTKDADITSAWEVPYRSLHFSNVILLDCHRILLRGPQPHFHPHVDGEMEAQRDCKPTTESAANSSLKSLSYYSKSWWWLNFTFLGSKMLLYNIYLWYLFKNKKLGNLGQVKLTLLWQTPRLGWG